MSTNKGPFSGDRLSFPQSLQDHSLSFLHLVSVKDCGRFVQITQPHSNIFTSLCDVIWAPGSSNESRGGLKLGGRDNVKTVALPTPEQKSRWRRSGTVEGAFSHSLSMGTDRRGVFALKLIPYKWLQQNIWTEYRNALHQRWYFENDISWVISHTKCLLPISLIHTTYDPLICWSL